MRAVRLVQRFPVLVGLVVGLVVWLPCVHFFFVRDVSEVHAAGGVPVEASRLAAEHLSLWSHPETRRAAFARMRVANAEWDFMARSFLTWSLAEIALRDPARQTEALSAIDAIVDETLELERDNGDAFFLMPYARRAPFVVQPARSLFVDGEIALTLALRRLVAERAEAVAPMRERIAAMEARMREGPVLSAESYPDECWTFCNTVALAAMRVADAVDGTDHAALARNWVARARERLVDPKTGMLVSSYRLDGTHLDGPEGSSIFLAATMLKLIDEGFASDQYARARRELGRELLGFGYAREWPASWVNGVDVDSGMIVPLLGASPGASGFALLGAAAFDDLHWLRALHASLDLAAFRQERDGRVRYAASNPVGDAVLLYSTLVGPAWARVRARLAGRAHEAER